jgi:uncharacterized membrane protein
MSESLPNQPQEGTSSQGARLFPVDALRGLIMVLMALDHVNHFVAQKHSSGEYWGGPFPVYPNALAFLTRWVTHLAAPGFFFLMGLGMALFALSRRRMGWSHWSITLHFLLRGALLIALQFLLVNRAWALSPGGWGLRIYVGVLYALGGAMMLGSLIWCLRPSALLALTVGLLLGTELLTPAPETWGQEFSPLSRLALVPGGSTEFFVNYPILPWMELVTFGLAFGYWLEDSPRKALRWTLQLGTAFLLAFLLLRIPDGLGNIRPREGNRWIDFLNVVKYPPSITFTFLTMGLNLVLLGLFARTGERLRRCLQPLVVFGRVPLFFYLTHLFLYAGLGSLLIPQGTKPLPLVLYWLLGVVILYPPCLLYGRFKDRQLPNSTARLF